jgi:hypothetical protein
MLLINRLSTSNGSKVRLWEFGDSPGRIVADACIGNSQAKGITEEDVSRLVEEVRRENQSCGR